MEEKMATWSDEEDEGTEKIEIYVSETGKKFDIVLDIVKVHTGMVIGE